VASPIDVIESEQGDGIRDAWCAGTEVDSDMESEQSTALMLVGVGTGTVENFAHFMWDYLLNLHRLLWASGQYPGQDGCCQVILHVRSIESLYEERPRQYYDSVTAVTGGISESFWQALKEIKDGTCFPRVILGFGAPQYPKAFYNPDEAHTHTHTHTFSLSALAGKKVW
jgi:hypothetical protein